MFFSVDSYLHLKRPGGNNCSYKYLYKSLSGVCSMVKIHVFLFVNCTNSLKNLNYVQCITVDRRHALTNT